MNLWNLAVVMHWQPTVLSSPVVGSLRLLAAMQDLHKYVTAAKKLWHKVEGRTHGREPMLKFLAVKLWNQSGVLQEVITL